MAATMDSTEVMQSDGRFFVRTAHGEAELLYRTNGKVMSIYHTYTPKEERGKGAAEKLADRAFEFAKARGMKVKPDCPYIIQYLKTHKDAQKYSVQQ